jgi:hypothetical protein
LREGISIFKKRTTTKHLKSHTSQAHSTQPDSTSRQKSLGLPIENGNAYIQKQNVELVAGQDAMTAELDQLKKGPTIQSHLRAEYFQENKRLILELEEPRIEVEGLRRKRKEECRKLEDWHICDSALRMKEMMVGEGMVLIWLIIRGKGYCEEGETEQSVLIL